MERYITVQDELLLEDELDEGFSTEKPKPESGYVITRRKKKVGGKTIVGWVKVKKKGTQTKKSKTGLSKAQLKVRARKAARTKHAHPTAMKKAMKKAKKTRAINR